MKLIIIDELLLMNHLILNKRSYLRGINLSGVLEPQHDIIHTLKRGNPDVILFCFKSYNGTQIDMLKKIRSEKLANCIIVFSYTPSIEFRQCYLNAGADLFFSGNSEANKVFEIMPLLKCIFPRGKQVGSLAKKQPETPELQQKYSELNLNAYKYD